MKQVLFYSILGMFISSCLKEEIPVAKHEAGDVITSSVNLSSNYEWQIYFNLEENKVVGQNIKSSWDLGFESSANKEAIILNSSKSMFVYPTDELDMTIVDDTVGLTSARQIDDANGDLSQTAIGDWTSNHIYVIDQGYNENGSHEGFSKVKILYSNESYFKFVWAPLNSNQIDTVQIPLDDNYNFSFFNLSSGQQVFVEPPKGEWDIVFSQYTHMFYEPEPTPYLVTGCLLNRHNTYAILEQNLDFDQIDLELASSVSLTNSINEIGYDWKTFQDGSYETDPSKAYIIRDQKGYFYKLRFIDFYTSDGNKGNPVWEYQKL